MKELVPDLGLASAIAVLGLLSSTALVNNQVNAQTSSVASQANASARLYQHQSRRAQMRPENFDLARYPILDANESYWISLLWDTGIVEPQTDYVAKTLGDILALTTTPNLSESQSRVVHATMQVGTQLYASNPTLYAPIKDAFLQTIDRSLDPEWVAMALSGLGRGGLKARELAEFRDIIKQRFPRWSQNVYLYTTLREIEDLETPTPTPPLADLLNWTAVPGQFQLYAICQQNRQVLCQAVIKDRNGEFVRENGKLWSVPLLLRSLHHLSWNFTRGQTPQGIYRVEGTVPQPDTDYFRAYGQFPLVKLFVPFEGGVKEFLPGRKGSFRENIQSYQALLPPSWQNYFPMQQAYWAGMSGRSLFRIHGSGEAATYFPGNRPQLENNTWSPTIGCLSALELYDDRGNLSQADMPKILRTLTTLGGGNLSGYLIVVEVPGDAKNPIALETIQAAIASQPRAQANQSRLP
jgi:type II secretory pathway pseudopilin PulG